MSIPRPLPVFHSLFQFSISSQFMKVFQIEIIFLQIVPCLNY